MVNTVFRNVVWEVYGRVSVWGNNTLYRQNKAVNHIKTINDRMLFNLQIFMAGSLSKVLPQLVGSLCFPFWLAILHFSPICQENLSKPSQCRLALPCKFNILQQDCRELSLYKNRHGFLYLCFSSVQQQKLCKSKPQKLYFEVYSTFQKLEGYFF